MPVTHEVDHERRAMRATADGLITMDDIRKHLVEERRDNGLRYPELIEAAGATVGFSAGDMRRTVDLLRALGHEGALGPTAIVVGDEVSYGMIRMLESLLDGVCELRPFRSRHEAERWLEGTKVTQ
jgi:hypothetical protein